MLNRKLHRIQKSQKWLTATNEPLMVEGEGTMKLTPYSACAKIYYSPYIEENVLATRDFQKTGFQILFPAEIGNGTGAWIINEENKIVYKTNNNYMIDIQNYTGIENQTENTKFKISSTVKSKLTSDSCRQIKHKVAGLQRRFGYPSKTTMLKLQHNIEDFPVTANQIRKHYVEFPWFVMGRMTRRTLATKENSQDAPSSTGDIVATDSIPIRTYGAKYDNVHLFIDSFSGYYTARFGKKNDTRKE